jgi:uncharacterized protein (TIGR01777 family)
MKVFITGATGQIGSRLVHALSARGDQVVALSRNPQAAQARLGPAATVVEGDPAQPGAWTHAVSGAHGVVNLAGESLFARRWNDEFKKTLRDSRVLSTTNVVDAISVAADPPRVLVSGSEIGYYGCSETADFTEHSPPGSDFLGGLCVEWEAEANKAADLGARVVLLRTGVVLDQRGGALKQMLLPFKLFLGGKVGGGRQWVSWIHHADEVGLILWALDNAFVSGPLNATAPNPVTNAALAQALGRALGRPSFVPTPAFAVRTMLGEVAQLVTQGQRVLPRKALDLGYEFKFPDIGPALADLLR